MSEEYSQHPATMLGMIQNTHDLVALFRKENELTKVSALVDPHLELAKIHREIFQTTNKAILFTNVKGTTFPVATNLYGSLKRIELALGKRPEKTIEQLARLFSSFQISNLFRILNFEFRILSALGKWLQRSSVLDREITPANLIKLPQITSWPKDGGPFLTLPLVYTESPSTGTSNLGMYRVQIFSKNECGMHFQILRGGGFHYHEAEQQNQALPVHIYLGGPPILTLSAIAPLPENLSELFFASLLSGVRPCLVRDLSVSPLPILKDTDFCIIGEIPPFERRPEGPFFDHYGYYSKKHNFPFVRVKKIFHRKNAIFPATVVGRPPQEDHAITCYLQDLFKPILKLMMPDVVAVWAYSEAGVHTLTGAVVKNRYPREALTTALKIISQGQLALTKMLLATDQSCDVKNIKELLPAVLERTCVPSDLYVLCSASQDTLDETGPRLNEGSKIIWLGVGEKKRALPKDWSSQPTTSGVKNLSVFCPGVLVCDGPCFVHDKNFAQAIAIDPAVKNWPLIFLVDDAKFSTASTNNFLWSVFTRFEPAADVYSAQSTIDRNHISRTPPIVIDCRTKPWYAET